MRERPGILQAVHPNGNGNGVEGWFRRHVLGIITLLLAGGAMLWTFARYPDRAEFEKHIAWGEAQKQAVDSSIQGLKLDSVGTKTDINYIKQALQRIEGAIGTLRYVTVPPSRVPPP